MNSDLRHRIRGQRLLTCWFLIRRPKALARTHGNLNSPARIGRCPCRGTAARYQDANCMISPDAESPASTSHFPTVDGAWAYWRHLTRVTAAGGLQVLPIAALFVVLARAQPDKDRRSSTVVRNNPILPRQSNLTHYFQGSKSSQARIRSQPLQHVLVRPSAGRVIHMHLSCCLYKTVRG